jgi:hypothetical protein
MRKLIPFVLVTILAFTLAACSDSGDNGGNSSDMPVQTDNTPQSAPDAPVQTDNTPQAAPDAPTPTESTAQEPADGGQAMDSLIQWMIGGTFSYDFTQTSEGPEGKTESKGSMAMDGKNMAITTEMTVEGQQVKSRVIIKDGVTYIVDDANKFIMKVSGDMNATEGMMTDYSGIALIGSGTGEIDGKTLPYEEYAESEMGATVRYYLDGGQVYGIESEYEGYKTVMIITNTSKIVPPGAFDLPEGYTEM